MRGKKVLYLCNGEKADCKKTHCYKKVGNEGCKYTFDVKYAKNFRLNESGKTYIETEKTPVCSEGKGV